MPEHPQSPANLAGAIRRVAEQAQSEDDLKIGVEKLLDPFIPKVPGAFAVAPTCCVAS